MMYKRVNLSSYCVISIGFGCNNNCTIWRLSDSLLSVRFVESQRRGDAPVGKTSRG
jgi:hypothetical protein